MVGMSVVTLMVAACLGVAFMARIQDTKTRDLGIVTDFAVHYLELVRAMEFDDLRPGAPINRLYDGAGGAPLIPIPTTAAWTPIDSAAYQAFHPDLVWLTNRSLEMKCDLVFGTNAGRLTTKHLALQLRWLPPLSVGSTQSFRLDLLRARDS